MTSAAAHKTSTRQPAAPKNTDQITLVREQKIAKLREKCRRSVFRFLRYVHIEDPDAAEKIIPFVLWPAQRQAMQTFLGERLTIVLKARQLGLTWLALTYALWRMLYTPGYTVVALSRGEDETKELVRRLGVMLEHLPRWLTRAKKDAVPGWLGPVYDVHVFDVTIRFPGADQPESRFLAETAAKDSGRSFTASLVLIDEWAFQQWAADIWRAAYPVVNRPTGGQVIGLSTAQPATLFQEVWEAAQQGQNGFTPVFLPWHADPRRTVEWYEATKRALPTTYRAEYPETPEEAFTAGLQVAFPMFNPEPGSPYVCRPFLVPRWWRRWMGHDPGYGDPFAWYWFAAAPDGRIVCYREFARRQMDERLVYSEQGRQVAALSVEGGEIGQPVQNPDTNRPVQERISMIACGWDAFRTNPQDGKSLVDYYRAGGLNGSFVEAPRDRAARYGAVLEAFKVQDWGPADENEVSAYLGRYTARLVMFESCILARETLPKLITDEKHPDQVKETPLDHYFDGIGYGLQAWHPEQSTAPKPKKGKIRQHKERLARRGLDQIRRGLIS